MSAAILDGPLSLGLREERRETVLLEAEWMVWVRVWEGFFLYLDSDLG
jgi:hypothetical protein